MSDHHAHHHGHPHGHLGAHHGPGAHVSRDVERGRLRWVLILTGLFMVAEVVGGLVSGSLALLADAGHMFTDVAALGLSLFAMHMAQRPANPDKTYGYVRLEILAALVNGAVLLLMTGFILWEAWRRFHAPVQVDGPVMLAVAGVGLAVNVIGAFLLHGHASGSLNVKGAYLHVLGDLLGSIGAILAAVVILVTGWNPADPVISVVISLLILVSAWRLLKEAADVLLEAAPGHIDVEEVLEALRGVDGLSDVHDLHVWTLTSGFVALSGHGVIDDPVRIRDVLDDIQARLGERGIGHVTFQLEPRDLVQVERRRSGGAAHGPEDASPRPPPCRERSNRPRKGADTAAGSSGDR